jgi:predicted  nucleic acid-binding Zn-ribbon protein
MIRNKNNELVELRIKIEDIEKQNSELKQSTYNANRDLNNNVKKLRQDLDEEKKQKKELSEKIATLLEENQKLEKELKRLTAEHKNV